MQASGFEPDPYHRNCATRTILDRIGDRWTVLVVGALREGPMRFSELSRRIDGVSQKMLTQTLRGLERDGLVTRTVHAAVPPKVEYELHGGRPHAHRAALGARRLGPRPHRGRHPLARGVRRGPGLGLVTAGNLPPVRS